MTAVLKLSLSTAQLCVAVPQQAAPVCRAKGHLAQDWRVSATMNEQPFQSSLNLDSRFTMLFVEEPNLSQQDTPTAAEFSNVRVSFLNTERTRQNNHSSRRGPYRENNDIIVRCWRPACTCRASYHRPPLCIAPQPLQSAFHCQWTCLLCHGKFAPQPAPMRQ